MGLALGMLWGPGALPEMEAAALNKTRILRKAGGLATGGLSQVFVTVTPGGGGSPTTTQSFDRTGKFKIPGKKGQYRTTTIHGPTPDPNFNTPTFGAVRKAVVKRQGKLIQYAGIGTNDYFDDEGNFTGPYTATSVVRGRRVNSTAKPKGRRLIGPATTLFTPGAIQDARAVAKGKSVF